MSAQPVSKADKVLVFGGAGFIGSHVVSELLKNGYEVGIFDRAEPTENLGCKVVTGDILDREQVAAAMEGYSVVYNFAGWADLETSVQHPVEVIQHNVLGNTIILEEARRRGMKRYVYASSMYVFSKAGSFYRASKQASELIVEEYQKQFNLNFTILRFGSLYGPGAKRGNAIFDMLTQAVSAKKIQYWGTGEELRQYIHVNDAARGSVEILSEEFANQYIILTGSEDVRIKDLLTMINEIMGNSLELNFTPKPRSDYHYKITPYSFNPRLGKKLIFRTYTDIGQGLLQCVQEVFENFHRDELDQLGQFDTEIRNIQ